MLTPASRWRLIRRIVSGWLGRGSRFQHRAARSLGSYSPRRSASNLVLTLITKARGNRKVGVDQISAGDRIAIVPMALVAQKNTLAAGSLHHPYPSRGALSGLGRRRHPSESSI